MNSKRWIASMAVTAALGIAAAIVPAGAANAATYDGANPSGHPCNTSQTITARSADIRLTSGPSKGAVLGRIELRYSPTCRTVWGRIINYMNRVPGDAHDSWAMVRRNSDGRQGYRVGCDRNSGTWTTCWTTMLNDANVTSYAQGKIDGYPTYYYTEAVGQTGSY